MKRSSRNNQKILLRTRTYQPKIKKNKLYISQFKDQSKKKSNIIIFFYNNNFLS